MRLFEKFRVEWDSNPWPAILVQCSTDWAVSPTGSWSCCEFIIYLLMVKMHANVSSYVSQQFKYMIHISTCIFTVYELTTRAAWHWLNSPALFFAQQDSIQKILLSLTSRIAETHLIHEKRRILSMYRLFVLLLLKDLSGGLGNTWAFFIRDVIYSLLRIISGETQSKKQPRQQQVNLVVDDDLFLPCCNLIYYVCKAAVECCSQVGSIKAKHSFDITFSSLITKRFTMCILIHCTPLWVGWCEIQNIFFAEMLLHWFKSVTDICNEKLQMKFNYNVRRIRPNPGLWRYYFVK